MASPARPDAEGIDASLHEAQEASLDARLVERVRAGDADAYGALVSRYMRRAFSVAYRILEHRQDAEDVVQDSFMRALDRIDQLDRGRPFRPWLLRIVVNQSLNFRRGRALRTTSELPDDARSTADAPDRQAANSELRANITRALAALPEKQRTIVQLTELEGMSSSEVGAILNMADGTVRWHLHEARKALRQALAPIREDA